MSTRKPKGFEAQTPVIHSSIDILSIQDGAFKQAGANETLNAFARYMIEKVSGFGTQGFKISPETKDELDNGYRLKFSQMAQNQPITYAVIGDNYIPIDSIDPTQKDKVKEKVIVGVSVACALATHEFGKLKNDNPKYHAVIGEWREKVSTYCSNRRKDLENEARRIVTGVKKGKRKANLNFSETVDQTVESLKTKLTKCLSLKDGTADKEKFNKALTAFLAVWKA
jgi:hypothetical protein